MILEPQKVLHLHKELAKKKPNIEGCYMVTPKYDGWYCYIDYSTKCGWGNIRNENRVIPAFYEATKAFISRIPTPREDCRFIMEAIIPDTMFHTLNGIFNRKFEQCEDVIFIIHDYIPLETYYMQIEENNAMNRWKRLGSTSLPVYNYDEKVSIAPVIAVTDDREIWQREFETVTNDGGEGIILKRSRSFYSPGKRNSDLMKLKLEATFDLEVVDMYWTQGEKGNDALNLLLRNAQGTTVPVRVGKDKDVAEFLSISPVGKVAEIRCMKQLEDGSYREPRFVGIRVDKNVMEID